MDKESVTPRGVFWLKVGLLSAIGIASLYGVVANFVVPPLASVLRRVRAEREAHAEAEKLEAEKSEEVASVDSTQAYRETSYAPHRAPGTAGSQPTEEECRAFAKEFAAAALRGDVEAINRLIDWEAIVQEIVVGLQLPAQTQTEVRREMAKFVTHPTRGFVSSLAPSQGCEYAVVSVRRYDAQQSVVLRSKDPQAGVQYYQLVLARGADNRVRAIGVHLPLKGSSLVEPLRWACMLEQAGRNPAAFSARIRQQQRDFEASIEVLEFISASLRNGQYAAGLEAYHRLPPSLGTSKHLVMDRLMLAREVGGAEYVAAIQAFRQYFNDETAIAEVEKDFHAKRGEYREALARIDLIDARIGPDPFLNCERAVYHLLLGDSATARAVLTKAHEQGFDGVDLYGNLLLVSAHDRDHDETLEVLKILAERFNVIMGRLEIGDRYVEFMKTPQYEEWQRYVAEYARREVNSATMRK